MRTRETLLALEIELKGDMEQLHRVMSHNRRAKLEAISGALP